MGEYEFTTQRFEMPDTGIGKSLGFESDKAFMEHQRADEAKLDPDVREALNEMRDSYRRRLLYGFPG
jgi:hypothetical protein